MIRRKQIITISLAILMSMQLIGSAVPSTRLINNTSEHSDYKLNDSECSDVLKDIKDTNDSNDSLTTASTRVKSGEEIVDALLDENLINRDYELKISRNDVEVSQNSVNINDRINRTNTLMYLSRTKEGNISSRPFVVTLKDNEKNVYVNNAIPELYLTRLLSEGIISEDEISDKVFIEEYKNEITKDISIVPEWSNNLQPYFYNDAEGLPSNQLGKTWKFNSWFKLFTNKPTSFKITKEYKGNYFVNEKISKLETLDFIYEMYKNDLQPFDDSLRETLLFKYGSSGISSLSKEEQDKVLLLIYNGIINRDNVIEVNNFDGTVTGEFLFPILYRLKHKEERISVNIMELSEGEKELAKDGFVRNDVGVFDGTVGIEPKTVSVKRADDDDSLAFISENKFPQYGDPDEDDSNYEETEESDGFWSRVWENSKSDFNYIKNSAEDFIHYEYNKLKEDIKSSPIESTFKFATGVTRLDTAIDAGKWIGNAATGGDEKEEEKRSSDYKNISEVAEEEEEEEEKAEKEEKERKNKDTSVSTENTDGEKTEQQTSNSQDVENGDNLTSAVGATEDGNAVDYEIVKVFPNPDKVMYKGVKVSEVTTTSPKDGYVKSVEDTNSGKKITFKVNAASDVEALAVIDSNTSFDVDAQEVKHLQTVTKVKGDKRGAVYISAKEIENSLGELVVVSNKVLKNKKTGAVAVLLTDHHKAMIGNRIIVTDEPIAITNTADTYYNMEFIAPLMSNAYISEIDPEKMFLDNKLPVEGIAQVTCKGGGSGGLDANLEKSMIVNSSAWDSGLFTVDETYFNLDMVTRGISCLTRELNINGKKAYVIIDWSYSLPDNDETILNYFKQKDLSVKQASTFLFTRPDKGKTQDWWDANVELSNALANVMYNTKKVNYITSGYLKPDITVLLPENGASEDDTITYLTNKLKLSSEYLKKYCDGNVKDFNTKLFNGGKGDVTGRRKFRVIKGKQSKNTEEGKKPDINNFDDEYVVTATGALYRNIRKDNRMKYDSSSNELQVSGRQLNEDSNEMQSTVKIGSNNYYVQKSGQYLALTDVKGYMYKFNYDNGNITFSDDDTERIKDNIRETKQNLLDNTVASDGDFRDIDKYKVSNYSIKIDNGYYKKNTAYLANGSVIFGETNNLDKFTAQIQDNDFIQKMVSTTNVTVFPTVYLPGMHYTVENGELKKKMNIPYLEQGNVLFSGINSTLMSRLIDDNADVIKYSELPEGCNVIIEDTTYKKCLNGLNSEPIMDSNLANGLASNCTDGDKIKSLVTGRFTGLQLLFSGRPVSFTSYITGCGIGTLEYPETHNTFYYKGNVGYFSNAKGSEELYKNQSVESVCINLKLDEDVQFYLLDATTDTYAIKYASDKYCDGYIDQINAFSEDLGFGIAQDAFLELRDNIFVPAENYKELFKQSQLAYHSMIKGDVVSIAQFVLTIILSYIIIASWIGTMILKGKLGLSLLLAIRNPSGVKGAEGIDLIKIFTAGVWNLDSDPKVPFVVIANILAFGLLYLVIDCGTIIKFMFY